MSGVEWEALPAAVRARVDESVLAQKWFGAVVAVWNCREELPLSLRDCQELVFWRGGELGGEAQPQPR